MQRGTFMDVPGYGRIEVKKGSEDFVQRVLAQYMGVNSNVKIERSPDYVGRYNSSFAAKCQSTSHNPAKRSR